MTAIDDLITTDLSMNPQAQFNICCTSGNVSNGVETKLQHKTTPISKTTIYYAASYYYAESMHCITLRIVRIDLLKSNDHTGSTLP